MSYYTFFTVFALTLLSLPTQAADYMRITPSAKQVLTDSIQHPLTLQFGNTLSLVKTTQLANGKVKKRFVQQYQQIPVWNTGLTITAMKSGKSTDHVGLLLNNIAEDLLTTAAQVSQHQAVTVAKGFLAKTSDVNYEVQSVERYIYQDPQHGKARQIYFIQLLASDDTPSRPHLFIDSSSGQIVRFWEGIAFNQTDGLGPGGNRKTGRYEYGEDHLPFPVTQDGTTCSLATPNVMTFNLDGTTPDDEPFSYHCAKNTYKEVNHGYSPLNDAQYFGQTVYQMYVDWFNTPPLSFPLNLRVHFHQNYENAFWNGRNMTFGDGYVKFYPLTSLDVVAHEISHGFTEQNSHLLYLNQSGGINESFSDIAGEAAEYFLRGHNDWLVLGEITQTEEALRYFDDPTKDTHSIGHADDYTNFLDVHQSSGVFNKAFYLLAQKPGWDIKKAFNLFVLANQQYWLAESNFNEAAYGVGLAAKDYGYQRADVCEAFLQVGVFACQDPAAPAVELFSRQPLTGLQGEADTVRAYRFDVPSNAKWAMIKTDSAVPTDDVDLYVRNGDYPTFTNYDCKSSTSHSANRCFFDLKDDEYKNLFIMIHAKSAYQNINLSADHGGKEILLDQEINGVAGQLTYYEQYSEGTAKTVSLSGGTGAAFMLVEKSQRSNLEYFDFYCLPDVDETGGQSCRLNDPGLYHILIFPQSDYAGKQLKSENVD